MNGADSQHSPFRDGFAALWHEPALFAAELMWRWCFWLSAWMLGIAAMAWFLDSLTIPTRVAANVLHPRTAASWLGQALLDSAPRLVRGQFVLLMGLTFLWCVAASAGRAATLQRLVAMFRSDGESTAGGPWLPFGATVAERKWHFVPLFLLNLLRLTWSYVAVAVVVGCLVAGSVKANAGRAGPAASLLVFGVAIGVCVGGALNWFFGLAPVLCVRNGLSARDALAESAALVERRMGSFTAVALGFSLLRLLWGGSLFLLLLGIVGSTWLPNEWIFLLAWLVTAFYFAGADLLYLARLGAYVSIAEDDALPPRKVEPPAPESPKVTVNAAQLMLSE